MTTDFNNLWESARAFGVVVSDSGVVVDATLSARAVLGVHPVGQRWSSYYDSNKSTIRTDYDTYPAKVYSQDHSLGTALWVEDVTQERIFEAAVGKAEEARDNLCQLEYAVSHDLMEPLRGVSSSLTALDRFYGADLPSDASELVQHAIHATRSMQKLLTDFISYVRVDTSDTRRQDKPVDLNIIVRDVLQSLRLLVEEHNATVSYSNLPTIHGDWRMLYQIFSNLISNALKFQCDDKPCTVSIVAYEYDSQWVIEVSDNGMGMPPDKVHTIFTPFIRLHKSIPGSGIGLAIVKRCVEHHSGTIHVNSTLGVGTTFRISLPNKCGTETQNPLN